MAVVIRKKLEALGFQVIEDKVHNLYGYLPGRLDKEPVFLILPKSRPRTPMCWI